MSFQYQSIGLSADVAKELQDLAKTEINKVRKVNNLLAHEKFPQGTHSVPHEKIERGKGSIHLNDRDMIPFVELETVIQVDREQLDDPEKRALKELIMEAGREFGQAMDVLLVNGQDKKGSKANTAGVRMPDSCNVSYGYPNEGLRGGGKSVFLKPSKAIPDVQELIKGIMDAKAELEGNGYNDPFDLILSPDLYKEAVKPTPNLQLPITTIKELLKVNSQGASAQAAGKILETPALNGETAILFKPDEIDVAYSYDGELQVLEIGEKIKLRLFGAFALRVKDPASLVAVNYNSTGATQQKGNP